MIMDSKLGKLFDSVLLVPLKEGVTNCLEELYEEVVGDEDFDIEECVCSFITYENSGTKNILNTLYENNYEESLILPDICYHLYDQYVVFRYVCQDDDIESNDKLKTSLLLRNELTLIQGNRNQMASYMFVDDICGYYNSYIQEAVSSVKDIKPIHILGQSSFSQAQMEDHEFFNRVKVLAIKAAKYDLIELKSKMGSLSDSNPYQKAYQVAQSLAHVTHWEYVITNVDTLLSELLSQFNQNKQLSTIKREMQAFLDNNVFKSTSFTTVILDFLHEGENEKELGRQKYTPLRFAEKLYYEFLSENY